MYEYFCAFYQCRCFLLYSFFFPFILESFVNLLNQLHLLILNMIKTVPQELHDYAMLILLSSLNLTCYPLTYALARAALRFSVLLQFSGRCLFWS